MAARARAFCWVCEARRILYQVRKDGGPGCGSSIDLYHLIARRVGRQSRLCLTPGATLGGFDSSLPFLNCSNNIPLLYSQKCPSITVDTPGQGPAG